MRHEERQFDARPEVVRAVRRFVAAAAEAAGVDVEAACLAASELATNVVRHARTPFSVRTAVDAGYLGVEFRDGSSIPPAVARLTHDRESGRGLVVVEASTTAWGVRTTPSGKTVWFELRRPAPRSRA